MYVFIPSSTLKFFFLVIAILSPIASIAEETPKVDYLSFAQGVVPIGIEGTAAELKVGMEHALLAIDDDAGGFSLTPKPGADNTKIVFIFQLPALTTFSDFAIPNVLETPSPSQTFVSTVEVAGSELNPEGPFQVLASTILETHIEKGQLTTFQATTEIPVGWVRVTLSGGIDIQRDKTFFEFSEIMGYGHQEPVALLNSFTGKWKDRGVLLELQQSGVQVSGCYDRVGDLSGTVEGKILRATGKDRNSGTPSVFVLTVTADSSIIGVRSTNGAPFRLYAGAAAPGIVTECSEQSSTTLGCGSIIHGINFNFDSATIRPESTELIDMLFKGLKDAASSSITVIGHTSSEGSEAYNEKLSQNRAQSVVAALVERGIGTSRILAQGRGEKQPIADNATGAGRSLNRRVEIECND